MVKLKKIIAIIIVTIIFTCLGLYSYLSNHYICTLPEKPQPEIGRIYPFDVHGTIVYLTQQEDSQLRWLFGTMMAFILIAFIYVFYFNPFPKNKNDSDYKRLY